MVVSKTHDQAEQDDMPERGENVGTATPKPQLILPRIFRATENLCKAVVCAACILAALYSLWRGVTMLDSGNNNYRKAYGLLIGASAILVLLPKYFCLTALTQRRVLLALISIAAGTACLGSLNWRLYYVGPTWSLHLIPLWLIATVLLVFAGYAFDSRRRSIHPSPLFDRSDWALAAGFFVVSWFARLLSPMSMAVDEGIHIGEMFSFSWDTAFSPWGVAATGYPWILHRLIYLVVTFLSPFCEPFLTVKTIVAGMGGLSVGVCFLIVRVFANRTAAATASTLLVLLGWHWLNSRFAYVYPYDLAVISIAILSLLVAFERGGIGPSVVAGTAISLAIIFQKCGVFLVPFFGLLCLEYLITAKRGGRRHVLLVACLVVAAALYIYSPFLAANRGLPESPRFEIARTTKATLLKNYGMTETQAFFEMWRDAFRQLQIKTHDIARHVFRPQKPLLDPIFSALFSIGLVAAIVRFIRSRECRLQLYGLLTFIGPMVVSFPLDSFEPQGLARRLLATSFFVAWIAASGAVLLSARLVQPNNHAKACLGLALGSLLFNFYYLKTQYEEMPWDTWYFDYGGKRAALMTLADTLTIEGSPAIVFDEPSSSIKEATKGRSQFKFAHSRAEVRNLLPKAGDRWHALIVPWSEMISTNSSLVSELSDVIAPSSWRIGTNDNKGIPMFGYTIVPPRQN